MIRGVTLLVLALAAGSGRLQAQRGAISPGPVREGRLWFDGHSSTGDFTGETETVSGAMSGAAELTGVRGWVEAPVATLKTRNGRRDRDLNKSMESARYPTIRFELEGVDSAGNDGPDSLPVVLHGRMMIHGITQELALPAALSFADSSVRVRSSFPLNLKDYRIGGLTKLLGMLRMDEHITVHVDVTFQSQPAAP
jgi:polyisoprenoid-binding protein YceI